MSTATGSMPKFSSPPVVEVGLSVHFDEIAALDLVRTALLWEACFEEHFPHLEQHPPLRMSVETPQPRARPQIQVEVLEGLNDARFFFLNEARTELVQVQRDFFGRNWRQTDSGARYPHYAEIIRSFESELSQFGTYLRERKIGSVLPKQCEVTYVNHIPIAQGGHPNGLGDVLAPLDSGFDMLANSPLEAAGLTFTCRIEGSEGDFLGRLRVRADSAHRKADGLPIVVLCLTARCHPSGPGIAEIISALDRGHELIVRGFAELTTHEMHDVWGRQA